MHSNDAKEPSGASPSQEHPQTHPAPKGHPASQHPGRGARSVVRSKRPARPTVSGHPKPSVQTAPSQKPTVPLLPKPPEPPPLNQSEKAAIRDRAVGRTRVPSKFRDSIKRFFFSPTGALKILRLGLLIGSAVCFLIAEAHESYIVITILETCVVLFFILVYMVTLHRLMNFMHWSLLSAEQQEADTAEAGPLWLDLWKTLLVMEHCSHVEGSEGTLEFLSMEIVQKGRFSEFYVLCILSCFGGISFKFGAKDELIILGEGQQVFGDLINSFITTVFLLTVAVLAMQEKERRHLFYVGGSLCLSAVIVCLIDAIVVTKRMRNLMKTALRFEGETSSSPNQAEPTAESREVLIPTPSPAPVRAPSRAPSPTPSRAPLQAPSRAPSPTPSRAPSRAP